MIEAIYKRTSLIIFIITLSIILSACSIIDNKISALNNEIPKWEINKDNGTQVIYDNKFYQIIRGEIDKNEIGKLIGRIGKIAILDGNYQLIGQEVLNVSNFFDIGVNLEEEPKYIVPFQNIYESQNEKNSDIVIVDVNGKYHKAISIDKKIQSNMAIEFEDIYLKFRNGFKLNKENYNQILNGDKIYLITKEVVDIENLDLLLDAINKTEIIDIKTGRKIDKSESKQIEIIPGKLSSQERKYIKFGDIYSIKDMDIDEFVAIKINEEYRLAKAIN